MAQLPDKGKVLVMAPETAARAHEVAQQLGMTDWMDRIYTLPEIAVDQSIIIDIDEMNRILNERLGEIGGMILGD